MTDDISRRFSHSLVDTMLDCPRKAMYRYVDEIPAAKGIALVKGSACDMAWNDALLLKMQGTEIELDDLKTRAEGYFREDVKKEGLKSINFGDKVLDHKESARLALASTLRMAELWHRDLYPEIEPAAVQVVLERQLPSGRNFMGVVDWSGMVGIHAVDGDNKTGSASMGKDAADKSTQASCYSWLRDEQLETDDADELYQFIFARAIDTKEPKAEFVYTTRSPADNEWYGQMIVEVEAQWMAGNFPPNPKSNLCSQKWCPYFERCQPHRVQR